MNSAYERPFNSKTPLRGRFVAFVIFSWLIRFFGSAPFFAPSSLFFPCEIGLMFRHFEAEIFLISW